MKVKIGNTIYDSNEQPIMLIFEEDIERKKVGEQLSEMVESDTTRKYVKFPKEIDVNEIVNFMKI